MGLWLITFLFAPIVLIILLFPYPYRYFVLTKWSLVILGWLNITCRLSYEVEGYQNLPQSPIAMVILSKHQSTWETLAMQQVLPRQTWVLKQELLWIPVFGWGLAALKPIAINRKNVRQSLQQLLQQGRSRLTQGISVIIFPEGTRGFFGEKKTYHVGGALLAANTGHPVLPISHNAGKFWPAGRLIKYPGRIRLSIGPLIETHDKNAREINLLAEEWIENTLLNYPPS